jgi:hypothetical protein
MQPLVDVVRRHQHNGHRLFVDGLERLYGWAALMRATGGGAVRWRNEYQAP